MIFFHVTFALFFVVLPTLRAGLESFTFAFFNAGFVAGLEAVVVLAFFCVVTAGFLASALIEAVTASFAESTSF